MKSLGKLFLLLCLFPLILALSAPHLEARDVIYLRSGEEKGLESDQAYSVVDVSYQRVTYKIGKRGKKLFFPTKEVRKIVFDTEEMPQDYREGFESYFFGDYQAAVEALSEVEGRSDRPWIVQYAGYYEGRAQQAMGRYQEAIKSYSALRNKVPTTMFYPHTLLHESECLGIQKDFKGAQKAIDELSKNLKPKELGEYWRHKCNFARVKLSEFKEDYAQAYKDFMSLKNTVGPDYREIQADCHVSAANCLFLQKNYENAIKQFKAAVKITAGDDYKILSKAYNGMGECYFRNKKYKDTLLAYLRVVVINENHTLTLPAEDVAKALFYSGWCFELLRTSEGPRRARENYRKCANFYGATEWGKTAAEKLK